MGLGQWLKDHIWHNGGVGEPIAAPNKKTRNSNKEESDK